VRRFTLTAITLSLALLAGCGERAPKHLLAGDRLYDFYCQECHQNRGPGAHLEKRDQSKPALEAHELFVLIRYGYHLRHKNLPSFPELTPIQTDRLVSYVIELQQSTAATELATLDTTE